MSGPLLVFGAAGQVGRELMALAAARDAGAIGLTRQEVDICDAAAVEAAVARKKPRLVVNCAAYTAVDKAESEPDAALAANGDAAGVIARAAARHGVPMLHLSTDYVFDGTKAGPYTEDDPIAPLGVYGRTKAAGEAAVREANPRHIILRTAWVYGIHGSNFLKTMLRLAGERDRLRVVADQRGTPTATADIAKAILAVDASIARGDAASGTFHFAGTGETTWHGFAEAIVAAQAEATGKRPPVEAITTADYPTPARRPANSALNSTRFAQAFGYRARPWQDRTIEAIGHLTGL
ncbi:dTDP-4-dehydrorhamnose reductase subunit, NAD(P)-binding, of dTDP-L-rhamnose synthase [Beijerinckiaceae bacterium RH AL1]|nr:dTDP-4-dehydrorhamnose reductase [Beijerinckiaceae bacterium]VVB49210.1 dTDP-4-dehydrorhamnose reductase subunit, NAD(P)-binding, of dTDP-L-rhamnose synthase [Beijerinckiaceae bacterium RH CH11]VVB49289.1 dTDP-4-dehydrorhamnose reductase subunit, NAD(P)-binding, of dTDP-L-rhamnose synthase [Beijerinckiaceae bacterium RH AL8]VVC56784.1 dTDP-4-dehydrorhamnose reductase subunit, NAD(P)-binding, of dTDP-L-rhamnose synthase [Beijerinckiaceae bacterium RH AL1]